MNCMIVWLLAIILLDHIPFIKTSSLSLKYQTCKSEIIDGFHLYTGTQNRTMTGHTCRRWDDNSLAPSHWISPGILAVNRTHRTYQKNFCRTMNPDPFAIPWCYTTNQFKKWGRCAIPDCGFDKDKDKYDTCMGEKINGYRPYTGNISKTKSGLTCQRWDNINSHDVTGKIIGLGYIFLKSQHNYCRTMYPDPHPVPWCYTMDRERPWEECNIPLCYIDDTVLISLNKPFYFNANNSIETYTIGLDDNNETISKTLLTHYNTWEVDLLQVYNISYVLVTNTDTNDTMKDDFREISIYIGDEQHNNWERCAYFGGSGKYLKNIHRFDCGGIGQCIRVDIVYFTKFRLLEVNVNGYQFDDNITLVSNKSALFVATSGNETSSPGVIGHIDTKFKPLLSWIHFWKVNMLKQYNITYIILHNVYTENEIPENLSNNTVLKIAVYLENKEQQNSTRCAYFEEPIDESRKEYRLFCHGIGQYIRVEKSKLGRFYLQNVEVFGFTYDDTIKLSVNKQTTRNKVTFNNDFSLLGEKCNNFTECNNLLGDTWMFNVLRMCKISHIIITSDDIFQGFKKVGIYIGDQRHTNWDSCVFEGVDENFKDSNITTKHHKFVCEGIGHSVRVEIFHFDNFQLQNVEVFGYPYDDDIMLLYNKSAIFVATYGHEMSSPDTAYYFNTNFKTQISWHNFWKFNLHKMYKIKYLILHNVYPKTKPAYSKLKIAVYLENSQQKYSTMCAYFEGVGDKSRNLYRFICEGIGQYIRVEKSQFGRFQLRVIEVFGYLYYDDALLLSKNKPWVAIEKEHSPHDGNKDSKVKSLSPFYNAWEVNLRRMHKISYVLLNSNVDTNGDFSEIEIYYGDNHHNNWEKCFNLYGPGEKSKNYHVACEGIAQYVRVDKSYSVKVFGYTIDNIIVLSSNKPTFMGTSHDNEISVHGVDGDIHTYFRIRYHTNSNYWGVNLLKNFEIRYVALHTEKHYSEDLRKISIYVTYKKDTIRGRCAYFDGPGEKSRTIYRLICEGTGKYVRVEYNYKGHLTLQEVEVYGINYDAILISHRKRTSMFPSEYDRRYAASNGVDGKNDTSFKTGVTSYNAWDVFLGRMCKISHVMLTNFDNDGNDADGFRNISVHLGDKYRINWEKCGYFDGPGENSVKYSTACEGIAAHIRVVKEHHGYFQLQEVEVFGYFIDDVIRLIYNYFPTFMSSTYGKHISSNGIDSHRETKFKTLYHDHSNYWAVNLTNMWNISYVSLNTVQNRVYTDPVELRNISIYISDQKDNFNERCAYFRGPEVRSRTTYYLICEGVGQFIRIVKDYKGILQLQDIEVYGKKPKTVHQL